MEGSHWAGGWHAAHRFSNLVVSDFVVFQGDVVAEQMTADLVCDTDCDESSPADTEDHVVRDSA